MSDIKLERKQSLSREEAAVWLKALADAFAKGGHAQLPLGRATVDLHIPDRVKAEFEVEVEGDEVEVELEFTWSTSHPAAGREATSTQDAAAAVTP